MDYTTATSVMSAIMSQKKPVSVNFIHSNFKKYSGYNITKRQVRKVLRELEAQKQVTRYYPNEKNNYTLSMYSVNKQHLNTILFQ